MKLFVVITTFLIIQWADGLPIDIPEVERVFDYHGETYIFSTLGKKQVSKWDIFAKLTLQTYKDHSIIKLNDIETSMFNGVLENQGDVSRKPIPNEAKVLGEPYILLYNSSIKTKPDEPNWSLNMKRAIAGILYVDINKINEMKAYSEEKTMYGDCNVTYATFQEDKKLKLVKTIKTDECGGEIQDYYSVNQQMECPELEHDQFPREVTRTYYINDKANPHKIDKIIAESSIIFQVTPTDVQTFHLKQIQTMDLKSYADISKRMDDSKATQVYDIKFEHGKFPMDGRASSKDLPNDELVKSLLEKLEALRKQVLRPESSNHWNISTAMDNIWDIFSKQTLKSLEDVYMKIKGNEELFQIYLSYLPYAGTTEAIQMMLKMIPNENVSDEHKIRMLAIFPKYINENSQELIEMIFEEFRELVTDNLVMNSIVMSVGQLLGNMKKTGAITQEFYDEYLEDYIKKVNEAKDYEDQIAFMMALKNMDSPLQTFLDFIKNEHLKSDLRIIAINSALTKFRHKTKTVRDVLLPILQNETHPLDLRVAALNGLIESRMPLSKFELVYNFLKQENGNLAHRHLYHYLYSSLASYKVDTRCKSGLATIAETYLPKMKEPTGKYVMMTGNYRIGFTDPGPDIGNTLHLRTIANPHTNAIETIEISQDTSMMGLHKKYTLYLKIRGIWDEILKTSLLGKKPKETNFLKEFVEILKKHSLKLHRRPLNVEIILFSDDKAVFTTQYTKKHFNNKSYFQLVLAFISMLVEEGILVKYPLMDYLHIPSDLGTDLTLSLDQEELIYHIRKNFEDIVDQDQGEYNLKYRHYLAISKSFSVYNPIENVKQGGQNINVRNLYFESTFGLDLGGEIMEVTINNQNLKFSYQSEMITELFALEEKILQKYCQKCEQAETVYDEKQATLEKQDIPFLSFIMSKKSNWTSFQDVLSKSINTNIGNYEVYPMSAVYFLMISHYLRDHYLPTWATNSMSLHLKPATPEPMELKFSFKGNYTDLEDEKEIYPGSFTELGMKLEGRRKSDEKLLHDIEWMAIFKDMPGLYNQTFDTILEVLYQNKYHKICFDLDTLSPNLGPDKYSLRLANPLPININLNYASNEKKGASCMDNSLFQAHLEVLCSGLDEQRNLMTKADHYPYKECKDDAKGKKYTPPTKACQLASKEMNRYRNYYFDLKVPKAESELAKIFPIIEPGMIYMVNGTHQKFSMEFGVESGTLKLFHISDGKKEQKVEGWPAKYAYKYMNQDWLFNSKDLISGMEEEIFTYGLTSTCTIGSGAVDTFNDHHIKLEGGSKETVALIECEHAKDGVIYKILEDGKLEMKVWFERDVILARPEDKAVKILINDKKMEEKFISKEKLKVYHLADDAIIIKGPLMEIYYNTEFINIQMYSIYNNRICGICSPQENLIHP